MVTIDTATKAWQNASTLIPPNPEQSIASTGDGTMLGGAIDLTSEPEVAFRFEANPSTARLAETPQKTFKAAVARALAIEKRVQIQSPDPFINAGIPCVAAAVDGLW